MPGTSSLTIDISGTSFSISMLMLFTFDIDADTFLLTLTKVIKDHKLPLDVDKTSFAAAERKEVDFLLKAAVTPVCMFQVPDDVDIQMLKWVLAGRLLPKTSSQSDILLAFSTLHKFLRFDTQFMKMHRQ